MENRKPERKTFAVATYFDDLKNTILFLLSSVCSFGDVMEILQFHYGHQWVQRRSESASHWYHVLGFILLPCSHKYKTVYCIL